MSSLPVTALVSRVSSTLVLLLLFVALCPLLKAVLIHSTLLMLASEKDDPCPETRGPWPDMNKTCLPPSLPDQQSQATANNTRLKLCPTRNPSFHPFHPPVVVL